ncbi:MAG: histidine phosphatase family protein [Micrococcales bacterium]|nr:histidine phosphatase family protein [Micrococcales bacterium]
MASGDLTIIHLLRHGEVDNPTGVLYERLPGFNLSNNGRAMAELAAAHLAKPGGRTITQLYVSPLDRAQQTAQPVAQALGLEIQTEPDVIEAQSDFVGTVVDLPHLIRPKALIKLRNPRRPSWGEPFEQIAARMLGAIGRARQAAQGQAAVIVSHQSPIWRARLKAEGRPVWPMPRGRACSLASVTSLTYEADKLVEVGYAEPAAQLLPEKLR